MRTQIVLKSFDALSFDLLPNEPARAECSAGKQLNSHFEVFPANLPRKDPPRSVISAHPTALHGGQESAGARGDLRAGCKRTETRA